MNKLKITSGALRGRTIVTPGGDTHPMGERERLALFNMIASEIPGALVLDAFAGSGALGIEALSRSAKKVVFVEKDRKAVSRAIKKNLVDLGLNETSEVFGIDVSKFTYGGRFDVVLADPPYDDFKIDGVVYLVKYLKESGVFVLSHPGESPGIEGLILDKSRKYAGATISVYRKTSD